MMVRMMPKGLEEGFILDRQWFWLRGEMERTKRPALLALARVFAEAGVPYAIIGGIALQVHQTEPRTTLDIAVAVATYGALPVPSLRWLVSPTPDNSLIPKTGEGLRERQCNLPTIQRWRKRSHGLRRSNWRM